MNKLLSAIIAGLFAVVTVTPVAFAQGKADEKKEATKKDESKAKADEGKAKAAAKKDEKK